MKAFILSFFLLGFYTLGISQYRTYDSQHNEINQTIIQTADNGFLIATIEFCYTPDEWVIEGCPIGIRLIKTDALGDSLWMKEIVNHNIQGIPQVFENRDGTFTLFASQNTVYNCKEWTIDPSFGLFQNVSYHLDENGNVISQHAFPNDCHENLLSAVRISDTTFALLTSYSEPFASDSVEGRLYRVNNEGIVLNMRIFPGQQLYKSDIAIDTLNQIWLFFVGQDGISRLNTYDQELNILSEKTNAGVTSMCLQAPDTRVMMLLPPDDQLFIMCDNQFGKGINTDFFTIDREMQLLAQKSYAIPMIADIGLNDANEVMVVSQVRTEEDSSDIKLTYFSTLGDSLITRQFRIPGNQSPSDLLALDGENFAIVGGHNCCNLSITEGAGETFLYLAEQSTGISFPGDKNDQLIIYPNPATDFISFRFNDDSYNEVGVTVFSLAGEILFIDRLQSSQNISLSGLAEGYYVISVTDGQGGNYRKGFVKIYD